MFEGVQKHVFDFLRKHSFDAGYQFESAPKVVIRTMRPCKIDSETFFGIFFVSVLYDCISVTYIGGCDRF